MLGLCTTSASYLFCSTRIPLQHWINHPSLAASTPWHMAAPVPPPTLLGIAISRAPWVRLCSACALDPTAPAHTDMEQIGCGKPGRCADLDDLVRLGGSSASLAGSHTNLLQLAIRSGRELLGTLTTHFCCCTRP